MNKINTLHTLNERLDTLYTSEAEDTIIIREYFTKNYEPWNDLLEKMKDDYESAKNLLKDEFSDIIYDIIPYINEIIYNGYTITKNRDEKLNLCYLLLQLRRTLSRTDLVLPEPTRIGKDKGEACRYIENRFVPGVGEGQKGGGDSDIKEIYDMILDLKSEPRSTKYVNDDYGNFYSVINDIFITKDNIKMIINCIYNIHFKKIVPKKDDMQMIEYICIRFLIYYLDDIYTRLFSLSGDNEEYDEDIYFQYLRIRAELDNINHYTYKDGNKTYHGIFTLVQIYEKNRYKWKGNYLEDFISGLRTEGKGLQNVYERLLKQHNALHSNFQNTIMLTKKLIGTQRTRKTAKPTTVRRRTQQTRKTQRTRTQQRKYEQRRKTQEKQNETGENMNDSNLTR